MVIQETFCEFHLSGVWNKTHIMMDWENLGWPKAAFSRMISSSLFLFCDSFPNSNKSRKKIWDRKMYEHGKEKKKGKKIFCNIK